MTKEWTDDVEKVLELIRQNSVLLSGFHKKKYNEYKSYLKYFKLPLIVLSSITSIASMGLTNYMQQEDISLLTCLLSLGSALIASIELYLGIQKSM
jgi:heme O synthase-like polyprenyltransferase